MTVPELVEKDPHFFQKSIPVFPQWEKVRKQAIAHTRRLEKNELYEKGRPNEGQEVKEYRENNERSITVEGSNKFINLSSRVFQDSGVRISEDSQGKALKAWLTSKPFEINGKVYGLWEYFYECLYLNTLESGNDFLAAFPLVKDMPDELPSVAGNPTQPIDIEDRVIAIEKIRHASKHAFAWEAGQWPYMHKGQKRHAPYYFSCDAVNWYRHIPMGADREGKIRYELQLWYIHNTGHVPATQLGGRLTFTEDGKNKYYESWIRPYFEYSDEFVNRFSDSQAVHVQHSYPATVVKEMPCNFKGNTAYGQCKGGVVVIKKDGQIQLEDGKPKTTTCPTCKGEGNLMRPGPYGTYVRQRRVGMDQTGATDPVIEYVTPPTAILSHSYNSTWDLFERAKKSIGLDLLDDTKVESGVAKDRRLQAEQDFLIAIALGVKSTLEHFLYSVETLLVPNESQRKKPVIIIPQTLKLKDVGQLREDVAKAPASGKAQALFEYYQAANKGDEKLIRAYQLYLDYTPWAVLEEAEAMQWEVRGTYDEMEPFRRSFGLWAFRQLQNDRDFMDRTKDVQLFQKADELVRARMPRDPGGIVRPIREEAA